MKKPYTKAQLLAGIRVVDGYLNVTEQKFAETEELLKDGVPDDFREEWEECIKERRTMKNIRALFAHDLRVNHGIEV